MERPSIDHLVIGDPHASPEEDNSRFDILSRFILDRQPEVIVCLGDMADMGSLSSYDKGKKSFEGKRFKLDVNATVDAQHRLFDPIRTYNQTRRRNKERLYRPAWYLLGGNHDEGRIARVVDGNPELDGVVDLSALKYLEFGWKYVPYKQPLEVDGVLYCHHFPSGIMGTPISGVNIGHSLLQKNHVSSTVGHDHRLMVATEVRADGKRLWGLSAGCFFERQPEYARDTAKFWWPGIVYKHDVQDGDFEPEFVSLKRLRSLYG